MLMLLSCLLDCQRFRERYLKLLSLRLAVPKLSDYAFAPTVRDKGNTNLPKCLLLLPTCSLESDYITQFLRNFAPVPPNFVNIRLSTASPRAKSTILETFANLTYRTTAEMLLSFTKLFGILIAALLVSLGSPAAIERRGDVTWYHQKEFFDKYWWDIYFTCFYPYNDQTREGCLAATDNKDWVAFTYDTPSNPVTYVWLEDDARTANCLFDLHHLQPDECISVRGSKCEAIKGKSKILNARVHGDLGSITTNETIAIQLASWAIVGSKVNSNQNDHVKHMPSGVQFLYLPNRDTWTLPTTIKEASYLSVVFGGAEQC